MAVRFAFISLFYYYYFAKSLYKITLYINDVYKFNCWYLDLHFPDLKV